MGTYAGSETGAFSSKPIELFRFIIGTPPEPFAGEGVSAIEEDLTQYTDLTDLEGDGWVAVDGTGSNIIVDENGVEFNIIGPGTRSSITKVETGLGAGDRVLLEVDFNLDGHWFEPTSFSISNGTTTKSNSANPNTGDTPNIGSKRTGSLIVPVSGEVTISVGTNGGIGHGVTCNDHHIITAMRVLVVEEGEVEDPEQVKLFFTSARKEYIFEGDIYVPLEIHRGEIDYGGEDKPGSLAIDFPIDSDLGAYFTDDLVFAPMTVQIIRIQRDAPDDPAYIYEGKISGFSTDNKKLISQARSFLGQLDEAMPRGNVQRVQCPWHTYDPFTCRVSRQAFTFEGTVSSITDAGLTVVVDGAQDFIPDLPGATAESTMFALGSLEFGLHKRMVQDQDGDTMYLERPVPELEVGDTVRLVAGDDRTKETCLNRFQNIDNFGAYDQLPEENPAYGQNLRP